MADGAFPLDAVRGDATGLDVPAHAEALVAAGPDFLTRAFRAFGTLAAGNAVSRIARVAACPGGSTGHKLFLDLEYARPEPGLHRALFVKFSRDFRDPLRDAGKREMASEARFAALSRLPGFPIRVPAVHFADYQAETGTGLIISQRIAFGEGGIEPHREKCLDHEIADPLPYYRVLVAALARLAAAHKSGRLPADIDALFPYDPAAAATLPADRIRFGEEELRGQVARYAAFVADHPRLYPDRLRDPAFYAMLDREVGRFLAHEAAIKRFLQSDRDLVALCHWNAHIDNAWFWRDAAGRLQCGLMDWGHVRQLNVAFALWGCLSGAGPEIWGRLDALLELFVAEYRAHGGPALDPGELKLHLVLYATMMGLAWLLEAPARIRHRLPEVDAAASAHDPIFRRSESARNQLHISTAFLDLWRAEDAGGALTRMLARGGG